MLSAILSFRIIDVYPSLVKQNYTRETNKNTNYELNFLELFNIFPQADLYS